VYRLDRHSNDAARDAEEPSVTLQDSKYMGILWMLIIGLIVGAIAKLIMPGKDPGGIIVTIILGIAGAFLAGFLGRAMGWYGEGDAAGFIASVIGAIILLVIYRMIAGRSRA
jgi:uncharacterized membrane protein YeaQ/YmgE (transglycosylase-associated protein family)